MQFSFLLTAFILSVLINLGAAPQALAYIDGDQEQALIESINQRLTGDASVQDLRCSRRHRTCWVKFSETQSCTLHQVESTFDIMIDDDGLSPSPGFIKRIQNCSQN